MAIAAYFGLEMKQFDAVNTFCNAILNHPVFVRYPEGFGGKGIVLKLFKALYGLRVTPLLWLSHLATLLENLGLAPIDDALCVYANRDLIVFFFVDDIVTLFHSSKKAKYLNFWAKLMSTYEMREIGDLE